MRLRGVAQLEEYRIELLTMPTWWEVTLNSGGHLYLWADGFSGLDNDDNDFVFSSLFAADNKLHTKLPVEGTTPNGDQRNVVLTVARIPKSEVATIVSATTQ